MFPRRRRILRQFPGPFDASHFRTALALCFLLAVPSAPALDPQKKLSQYNVRTWSRHNGLPATAINAIAQTGNGFLWLGAPGGLIRFDGIEFVAVDLGHQGELRSSSVTALTESAQGGLWVGLDNSSFGYFDGTSFSFKGGGNVPAHMNPRSILEEKGGGIWLIAQSQLARYSSNGVYSELIGEDAAINIMCGLRDSRGRLWLGTDRKGLHYWENEKLTKVSRPDLDDAIIRSLAEDREGHLWIGTTLGLQCLSPNLEKVNVPYLIEEVLALLVDKNDRLWIGTSGRGLLRLEQGSYSEFRKTDGLANDHVRTLAQDREGNLWIGTRDGLSQLMDVKFPTHPITEGAIEHDVLAVTASQRGGVWIASSGGITYFDGKAITYGREAGLTNPYIKRIFEATNGDVYLVSGLTNLMIFSEGKVRPVHSGTNQVVGMVESDQGVVVSIGGSIYRAAKEGFSPYPFTGQGEPPLYWILNLAPGRDGAFWAASVNGICRIKNGSFEHWGPEQGLSDQRVDWVLEDSDGVVWAAMITGIARLKDGTIRCISRENGLFANQIRAIIPDDYGQLWIDSARGIFRVSRKMMNDVADGKIERVECVAYDGPDSVRPEERTVQEISGCKSLDGRIWFPRPKGVVVIDPAHVPQNKVVPPVHIDRGRANRAEFTGSASSVIRRGKGELEFHFTSPTFVAPEKVRFLYRLEGYDPDWVDPGQRRLAFYANLKPGRYTFRVIAANADGIWNLTGDSLPVELLPYFYQTRWFQALLWLLGLGLLGGGYQLRIRHLRRKELELLKARDVLENKVKERTATLAEANVALKKEIEERERMQREVERVHRELMDASRKAGMAEIATGVLHNVGNALNSVVVSASLVSADLKKSKVASLARAVDLLEQNSANLAQFISADPKGKLLPDYLKQVSAQLINDQNNHLKELALLRKNIEHIEEIISMQQRYARFSDVAETIQVADLVEDALRMHGPALTRHQVEVIRDYQARPETTLDKHKLLQILLNLVQNAKDACGASKEPDKRMTVQVSQRDGIIRIAVQDNGIGIESDNLVRIFSHGFTTRPEGHGFGLHSSALAAQEMGASIRVESEGVGRGATFIVELPVKK